MVSYEVLLYQVKNSEINDNLPNVTGSFLHKRDQRVVLNVQSSGWTCVKVGGLQGVIFFICINDLGQGFISGVKLFADGFSCGKAFASALNYVLD